MRDHRIYKISDSPLILAGSFGSFQDAAKIQGPFTYIHHNAGWINPRNVWRYVKIALQFKKPARVLFVTNEPSEARWLKLAGLNAVCLGQNMHVREHFFTPGSSPKLHDAVYTAQMSPFKRLHLASKVESLYVVTYLSGEPNWDLHSYEPGLKHADFNPMFISKEEVRDVYQRSTVGLALSAVEGAMWASCEYLMAGLPVVSTPNRGGRDRYFEPWYAPTVDPTPEAIAAAVDRFVKDTPSPGSIRDATLAKMRADRLALLDFLASKYGMTPGGEEDELERLWGGVQGIENHGMPSAETAAILAK